MPMMQALVVEYQMHITDVFSKQDVTENSQHKLTKMLTTTIK